ncbi:MAG TPA: hypothetical protein VHZ95_19690, partial [Polyangiales bacterium]|nr:hypothetical protein [Polyangiales bacterium]
DAEGATHQVWIGALIGLGLLSVVAVLLLRVGKRLRPAPFMLGSSVFLALLTFVLLGKGLRALQEAAVVPVHRLALPELPLLGVYATREGLAAQGALLLILAMSALLPWLSARRESERATAGAE